ncbi:MAG: nitroreductase family protein [Clostridia bacterium]|nr:nitroreductase family protein [Clostridia bacterium]
MTNPVVEAILKRRTIREYKDTPLSREILQTLLDCAMWAPSGRNSQPCHVRVIKDKSLLKELDTDFWNKVGRGTPAYTKCDVNPVYQGAPSLFLIYTPTEDPMNSGLAAENIAIAAEGLGLGSCIIASVGSLLKAEEGEKWKKIIDIPEDFKFQIAVAVGEKAEDPAPKERHPENFRIVEAE